MFEPIEQRNTRVNWDPREGVDDLITIGGPGSWDHRRTTLVSEKTLKRLRQEYPDNTDFVLNVLEQHLSFDRKNKELYALIQNRQWDEHRDKRFKEEQEKHRKRLDRIKPRNTARNAERRAKKLRASIVIFKGDKEKTDAVAASSAGHGETKHVDHIIPLSRGGAHHYLNLETISKTENVRKHNKIPSGITEVVKIKGVYLPFNTLEKELQADLASRGKVMSVEQAFGSNVPRYTSSRDALL